MDYELPEDFLKQFELLKIEFNKKLPGLVNELQISMNEVNTDPTIKNLKSLYVKVHNLAGSSGLYGFSNITNLSRDFEQYIKPFVEQTENISTVDLSQLNEMFMQYMHNINNCVNG